MIVGYTHANRIVTAYINAVVRCDLIQKLHFLQETVQTQLLFPKCIHNYLLRTEKFTVGIHTHIALHSECANGMGGSPLPAGKLDQNIFSQSGSSKTYGSTLVSNREHILILLCATAVLHSSDKFLDRLVAQRGQICRYILPEQPDFRGWHKSKYILHIGYGLRPELIPKIIVLRADGLCANVDARLIEAHSHILVYTYLGLRG
ncbi:hypothetical protein AGLY_003847 [Aphis glycines]|uniref:Uncharacterized protein n=1 Tax=Aphis glycines TaxID=307491 RepID=A0A6G0TZC9_APHGL|nr:hypothetical protein AGLY_003847 [Aphis glycines]